ncbi:MAG TPA: mechanosensitive ion channel protein MscS [Cyanothece sp. UBA12306]|nr:mechanosensitive ion channel protein MscS [Cyanothece sp. UBA12306]
MNINQTIKNFFSRDRLYLIITLIFCIVFVIFGQISKKEVAQNYRSSIEQRQLDIEEISQTYNLSRDEAKKLLEKRDELDSLGLFNLSSGKLGNLHYRAIKLDSKIIFPIAINVQQDDELLKERVQTIENTLDGIIKRNINPDDLKVLPAILNNETVLVIYRTNQSDTIDENIRQQWILMTLTSADSQLYGIPIPILSRIMARIVSDALTDAWKVRQPHYLLHQGIISLGIFSIMIIASWLLIYFQKYILPRRNEKKYMFWNSRILQLGHAIIWFPGLGRILKNFPDSYEVGLWLQDNTLTISVAIISFLMISRILDLIVRVGESHPRLKTIPIRVFVQLFYILIAILFILIIMANWINQPVTNILAAVGAGSAIFMLIFKDSIMGFTAGIQLAANRMLSLGDWIEMPQYGADGFVNEINLFTVKVLNWDNTITLIPTYALISNSFKNWQAMFKSGGRKIQRSVYIDMNFIKPCDGQMLERFSKIPHISEYIQEKLAESGEPREKIAVISDSILAQQKLLTNIGVFRAYVTAYLKAHPKISDHHFFLVRQLQPTDHGLPIEAYVYCTDTAWADYETVQSDIFEHILSIVPQFDLKVFQNPTGYDLHNLRSN